MSDSRSVKTKIPEGLPADIARDVQKAVAILRKHGASRVILYGSLARGDYHTDSDIDIGFEGIPHSRYFRVVAECLMNIPRRISVVDLTDTYGVFRARIDEEGQVLYEHGTPVSGLLQAHRLESSIGERSPEPFCGSEAVPAQPPPAEHTL